MCFKRSIRNGNVHLSSVHGCRQVGKVKLKTIEKPDYGLREPHPVHQGDR